LGLAVVLFSISCNIEFLLARGFFLLRRITGLRLGKPKCYVSQVAPGGRAGLDAQSSNLFS
jgi:hypothetical protein